MIGTHNSMTGYPAKCRIVEWMHPLWRCQERGFNEQLYDGVKYFDIRVRYGRYGLVFCHGMADVQTPSWLDLCNIIESCAEENAHCRIIIERGKMKYDIINYLSINAPRWKEVVDLIVIKKGWKVLYNTNHQSIIDYSYVPFLSNQSVWFNIKRIFSVGLHSIKGWAKKHNPKQEYADLLKDDTIHFMDFYNLGHDL